MKIALAQLDYTIADINGNRTKIIAAIQEAKNNGAELIVFSELAVCGYPPDDLLDYPHFIEACNDSLKSIAAACDNITAIVGCPIVNEDEKGRRLYNSACVLSNGQLTQVVNKTLLPTYDVFSESRYFESNDEYKIVEVNNLKIALTICEDLWNEMDSFDYEYNPVQQLMVHQPNIIINISASPFNIGKHKARLNVLKRHAIASGLNLIYLNQTGVHTDLIFDGRSTVLNGNGEILMELSAFAEELSYYETNIDSNALSISEEENETEVTYEALVYGLKEYFNKMGFKKAVLGSSGGIDSAVVQALASAAIGAENVTAILMPSEFSTTGSVTDAEKLSIKLGNPYHILPIENIYQSFTNGLHPLFEGTAFNIAEENLQARSRAVLLMAISNKFGNILLNTSNKSEMSVGYTTLYGDMCGSLSVIGDVFKTKVYELAAYINRNDELIPNAIIQKAPSAELRHNQKDSDSLPEYPILDDILRQYVELQMSAENIIESGHDQAVVERVIRLVNNSEYKRFQAPPILRISNKSFGRGRIIPLVSKW
ncbi:MAG TPA: NAD+ synthase [Bacteroidia bacterium]